MIKVRYVVAIAAPVSALGLNLAAMVTHVLAKQRVHSLPLALISHGN
jgi:hypothetical protein